MSTVEFEKEKSDTYIDVYVGGGGGESLSILKAP